MPPWVFGSWESLGRTAVSGIIAYVALVALLRVSGKRTLSKMNAFDFIITVAFGSLLATITLSRSVPLVNGVLALALLVGAQLVVTWLSVRSERFQKLVKADPTIVFHRGRFLEQAMKAQRVTREEVLAAMRKHGAVSPEEVGAVVLETEGSLSVMQELGEHDEPQGLRPLSNPEALEPRDRPPPSG